MATPKVTFNGYATALPATADLSALAVFNVKNPAYAGGAKGDGVHDDTAAIQAAIDAAQSGGSSFTNVGGIVYLPPGQYNVSSVLTVSSYHVGIVGAGREITRIISTSTTADIIAFIGPSSSEYIQHCYLKGIEIGRASAPAIGSNCKGVRLQWTGWVTIEDVTSYDSTYAFYLQNTYSTFFVRTYALRSVAYQGAGDKFYGYYLTDGLAGPTGNNVTMFLQAQAGYGNAGSGVYTESWGFYETGSDLRDIRHVQCESDNLQYGYYVDGSGTAGTNNWDLQFTECTTDSHGAAGFYFKNLNTGANVTLTSGWANAWQTGVTSKGIVLDTCIGVTIQGLQIFMGGNYAYSYGVYATNCTQCKIDVSVNSGKYPVYLDSVGGGCQEMEIDLHLYTPLVQPTTVGIQCNGAIRCKFTGVMTGNAAGAIATAIAYDNATDYCLFDGIQMNPGTITTLVSRGTSAHNKFRDCTPYNPVGAVGPPAVPSSGTPYVNGWAADVDVYITTPVGVTVSAISIGGAATGLTMAASSQVGPIPLPAGQSLTLTYAGGTPSWTMFAH